jgi:signal transduction histidine kinase/CheY-like chemotaxis protein
MHDSLFGAEMLDLKREIMTWGVLVPLLVLGYVGVIVSYQRPFIANLDLRIPALFGLSFGIGLGAMLLNRVYPRVAMWVAGWGALLLALLFCLYRLDGATGAGIALACGMITLLLGPVWGWGAVLVAELTLVAFAALWPGLGLWPARLMVNGITAVFAVVLCQMVTRVLFRALSWMQENYHLARAQTDALTDKSAQLELALKSLGQTSFQLARANEQMEVAIHFAEEARQSKQQFAAAVSHELRAPLNLIIGYSDLIINESAQRDLLAPLPPKLLADIHVIHNHAQHLLKLVNDILDLSQMDVNYLTISRTSMRIQDVVQAALDDYEYLAKQRNLQLNVQVETGLPSVQADPTRIRQVLLNLLNNALRFTEHGAIHVYARQSTLQEQQRLQLPNAVVVSVEDTGSGIAAEDLQRIFEPFVQVGDFSQRKSEGSGLGLTISKRFVELHGGRMWVESTPGVGSTFYIALPTEGVESSVALNRLPHDLQRREVGALAVVERTPVLSRLIARHIEGMQVESVPVLADLCAAERNTPEVILINEPMTELPELPALPPQLERVPVFRCYVHGALTLPAVDSQSSNSQQHYYLIKPVQHEQLYAALGQMLAAARDEGATITSDRPMSRPGRPARVLIVEDDDDASYMLGRMIRLMSPEQLHGFDGVTLLKARSGEQALELLNEALPIDAVLLDLVLGATSGYTVLAKMENSDTWRDIPVCVVTGQVASGDLLVTPYLAFSRKDGLSARELAQAVAALTRIALPGVDVTVR